MDSIAPGHGIAVQTLRDRIQLPVVVEIISNFSKFFMKSNFSCRFTEHNPDILRHNLSALLLKLQ